MRMLRKHGDPPDKQEKATATVLEQAAGNGRPRDMQVTPHPRRKLLPHEKAHATGRWAEIIFLALSTRVARRWKFISFRGVAEGEWRGVVDVFAVRKDTSQPVTPTLKRGDLFEIILVQVKGGSARTPSIDERRHLREIEKYYRARDVVLFQWRRGESSEFFKLQRNLEWKGTTGSALFG
jgi:hypothetical protein